MWVILHPCLGIFAYSSFNQQLMFNTCPQLCAMLEFDVVSSIIVPVIIQLLNDENSEVRTVYSALCACMI